MTEKKNTLPAGVTRKEVFFDQLGNAHDSAEDAFQANLNIVREQKLKDAFSHFDPEYQASLIEDVLKHRKVLLSILTAEEAPKRKYTRKATVKTASKEDTAKASESVNTVSTVNTSNTAKTEVIEVTEEGVGFASDDEDELSSIVRSVEAGEASFV